MGRGMACCLGLLLGVLGAGAAAAAEEANPLVSVDREVDRTPWAGLVTQALRAGPYTYLRVRPAGAEEEERWVVTLRSDLDEGWEVRVTPIGRKASFHSARLDQDFVSLWFAAVRPLDP